MYIQTEFPKIGISSVDFSVSTISDNWNAIGTFSSNIKSNMNWMLGKYLIEIKWLIHQDKSMQYNWNLIKIREIFSKIFELFSSWVLKDNSGNEIYRG